MKTKKKKLKVVIIVFLCFAVIGVGSVFGVNAYVKGVGNDNLLTAEQAAELEDA